MQGSSAARFGVLFLVLAIACAALAWLVIDQRRVNQQILTTLNNVRSSLDEQSRRSRELESTVAALTDRVTSLEHEVVELRRRFSASSPRASAPAISRSTLDSAPLLVVVEPAVAALESPPSSPVVVETIPIAWKTDWTRYQPAGILAQPPEIALQRKLTDPAFVKKLYWAYVGLQAADVATTTVALRNGRGREGNPLLRDVADSPARLIAVKAATTVATIYTVERLRERHPMAATITLIAINAMLAAVTVNNINVATGSSRADP